MDPAAECNLAGSALVGHRFLDGQDPGCLRIAWMIAEKRISDIG
jgi:hypothetical protein